ncbi:MAG TPA: ABC transporter permease [Opitutaceae bacterium]|nr:ABC transporter permease [Opitutaceae bacterium]
MNLFQQFFSRLAGPFRGRRLDREMAEEMAAHLDRETEQNLRRGLPPDEARYAARRAFGGVDQLQERERDSRGWRWLEDAMRDMRLAVRTLAKNPGFTTVAALSLALGIGACTAMFSIVNRILLQPLPYADPQRLVQLWEDPSGNGTGRNTVAGGVVEGWREQTTTLEGVAAIHATSANLTGVERPVRLRGLQVSSNYLRLLRLQPVLGRDFQPAEGEAGQTAVVILSHAAWEDYFGGRPDVVGQTVRLGEQPVTVAGILGTAARLTTTVDFLQPFAYGTLDWNRAFAGHNLTAIGRLKPTATLTQVRQEMAAITERQRANYPAFKKNWGVLVVPMHEEVTGPIRPQLLLLFGATACVLLIACANVAGLLLARAVSRHREMAVRLTLGASRWSVARMLLTENILLALLGGGLGVLLAYWSIDSFQHLRPADLAPGLTVSLDARALAFALAVSLLTGLAAGLVPAWRLARTRFDALKVGPRASGAGIQTGLRGLLMVGQIALSLMLLVGAGLLFRTLVRLQSVPLGFEPSGVLLADLTLDPDGARNAARRVPYLDEIVRRVEALPGVDGAGIACNLPLQSAYTETVRAEGTTEPEVLVDVDFITGRFFETMRIPLLKGRRFAAKENRPGAPATTLISAHLAAQLFGKEDPLGHRIRLLGQDYEVVGITGDVAWRGAERGDFPAVYLPEARADDFTYRGSQSSLAVRTRMSPLALAKSVQAAVLAAAPDQPLSNLRTYDQVLVQMAFARRLLFGLLSLFAAVALALAAIGLYGIIAFSVGRRTHELGIRSALGAPRRRIALLVLVGGLRLTAAGIALGLLGAAGLTRFVASFLFGVSPTDPLTILGVTLLLVAISLLACWLPARRAARVDPIVALRAE